MTGFNESFKIGDETVEAIRLIEEWHVEKTKELDELIDHCKKAEVIDLNGTKITNPDIIKGIKFGLSLSKAFFGELPFVLEECLDEGGE